MHLTSSSITVAGPLLTEKTSLILYVFRTCPARIRPGKRHELPIKKYNVTHNYFQIGWCNCNARLCQHLRTASLVRTTMRCLDEFMMVTDGMQQRHAISHPEAFRHVFPGRRAIPSKHSSANRA